VLQCPHSGYTNALSIKLIQKRRLANVHIGNISAKTTDRTMLQYKRRRLYIRISTLTLSISVASVPATLDCDCTTQRQSQQTVTCVTLSLIQA